MFFLLYFEAKEEGGKMISETFGTHAIFFFLVEKENDVPTFQYLFVCSV